MRLPVIGNISTKDGATNKNARLTNMLAEQKKNGTTLATVRPGLNALATSSGNGNNLVCFGGELVNIYGNTVYKTVPVGGAGAEYSINYLPVSDYWNHVIWNGSKFCAVGYTYSATSTDGLTWEYGSMPFSALWCSVAWNGTIFCAVMSGLSVYSPYTHACATSSDGVTWTTRELPTNDEEDENGNSDIASNGSLFVTAAYDSAGTIYTSSDGITWTPRSAPTQFGGYGGRFAYGNGKFVGLVSALGTTYCTTSSDGITWSAATTPSVTIYGRPSFENNIFVVPSSTAFQYSADGVSWSSVSYGGAIAAKGIVWDGEKYLAHGYEPVFGGANYSLYSSTDGITWSPSSLPTGWWQSSAYNGTNVVMVGNQSNFVDPNWNSVASDIHLINISDPTYTLEEIGTMTDGFFDFALIP